MRPKPPEPQPFARVLRRGISWFLTCAVMPALVGALAITHLEHTEMELNVDGSGGVMEIPPEPGDPEIFIIPDPIPAEQTPAPTAKPAAPAPAPAADPVVEPSPTPDVKIDLPKLKEVVPDLLGR